MLILLNACVMPKPGNYTCRKIALYAFRRILQANEEDFKSYIGYPQTAQIIEEITGIKPAICRETTKWSGDQEFLVIKLKYRIKNYKDKAYNIHGKSVGDYEFYMVNYKEIK